MSPRLVSRFLSETAHPPGDQNGTPGATSAPSILKVLRAIRLRVLDVESLVGQLASPQRFYRAGHHQRAGKGTPSVPWLLPLLIFPVEHVDLDPAMAPCETWPHAGARANVGGCSDTGFGESLYLLINVYVFLFLTSESIAPCASAGVGLVVCPVERVKGQT